MQIGAAQSQSLISSIAGSSQITASTLLSQGPEAPREAVLLSLNRRVDGDFAQRVVADSVQETLTAALDQAGLTLDVESLLSSGLDFSPEATSQRIVEFAISFFDAFKNNHQEDGGEEQLDGFVDLIKDAVEEGFAQAGDILAGIGNTPGKVADDIDRTQELVMQGIDRFADEQRDLMVPPPEEGEAPSLMAI